MKKFWSSCGLVLGGFLLTGVPFVSGQTTEAASTTRVAVPNPPMTMDVPGALPASFRGGNTDDGPVNVLEDGKYKIQEHSVLYEDSSAGLGKEAAGTKFSSPPTINWTTEKEGSDGSLQNLGSTNNNKASVDDNFFAEPGTYRIHNGGARQVSGGTEDTGTSGAAGSTASGSASSGATGNTGASASSTVGAGSATGNGATGSVDAAGATTGATGQAQSQRVTSNQTLTVISHDCTSPNLWAVIQEGAGSTNLAVDEQKLKDELNEQMSAAGGNLSPETTLQGNLKSASILAVAEMPKNLPPAQKTAAVFVKGPLFDETGKILTQTAGVVPMVVSDAEKQMRSTQVGEKNVRGVFVRRNIPFLTAAQMTDNGTYDHDGAHCRIINKSSGQDVAKIDAAYLFRVANFPRETYKDQPEYEFVMDGADEAGNRTEVRVPLYVVNTQASFEGGKAE
ncbi:MAG: hypothetical protein WA705_22505 [Candidatus Ozemobacteraceae bacterium]